MRSGIRALGRYSRQGSFATRAMDKLHMTTWLYFKSRIGEVRRTPRGRVPLDKSLASGGGAVDPVVFDLPVYYLDQVGHSAIVHVPYALVEPGVYVPLVL
jgi:hypothetical protein